jgi:hypothetical protein
MLQYTVYSSVQIVDRRSCRVWLIDSVLSPPLELLDPEVNTWMCMSSIAMDLLKPLMNLFGQASFLPDRLDHCSLLEFAHLTLKDIVNGSQTGRVDD